MRVYLLVFTCAVLSSALWPCLVWRDSSWFCAPFIPQMLALLSLLAVMGRWWRRCWSLLPAVSVFTLGLFWASLWGAWMKAHSLPLALDKTDYYLVGVVRGIPQENTLYTRFIVEVESLTPVADVDSSSEEKAESVNVSRVMLDWYGGKAVLPGERWQLQVRLRAVRGFANPGGFDYAGWLFRQGLSARGYIRKEGPNERLEQSARYLIDQFRSRVSKQIEALDFNDASKALLAALSVGDKQGLSRDTWDSLRLTGTVHLVVVSGLHIGMVGALGMLLGNVLGRCLIVLGVSLNRQTTAVLVAAGLATSYALLAGFSLATQRALIMLSVFLLAALLKRRPRPELPYLWALALVAAVDPLAALASGFWLSFGAVAVFLFWFAPRPRGNYLRDLCAAQLIVFLPMAGALLFFQDEVSLLAPLINLLVIPWLGFAVVPLVLMGTLLLPLSVDATTALWGLAGWQLEYFDRGMSGLAEYSSHYIWLLPVGAIWSLRLGILLAAALMLIPGGLGLRRIALVLLLAVLLVDTDVAARSQEGLKLTVLDVGQGLSVIVESAEATLVYDTGPRFSDSFDAGSDIITPYLHSQGVAVLDVLVISHSDADHRGGVGGLLEHYRPGQIFSGQPEPLVSSEVKPCFFGQSWHSAGVDIEVLHPLVNAQNTDLALLPWDVRSGQGLAGGAAPSGNTVDRSASDNDSSCVLLIRYGDKTALLTGDISAEAEAQLLARGVLPEQVDVLVAPHHGSRSSSSQAFVDHVSPAHVVYSAGFNHHFGHPHQRVVERYQKVGAKAWLTAESGALIFTWTAEGHLSVQPWRPLARRYWH